MTNFNTCFIELESLSEKNGKVISFDKEALKVLSTCSKLFDKVYSVSEITKNGKVNDKKLEKLLSSFKIAPLKYVNKLEAILKITKEDDFIWLCNFQDQETTGRIRELNLSHCIMNPSLFDSLSKCSRYLELMHKMYDFFEENKKDILKSMVSVKSSNISKFGYSPEEKILFVKFKSARLYAYYGVGQSIYDTLLKEESKGTAFNKLVKEINEIYIRLE